MQQKKLKFSNHKNSIREKGNTLCVELNANVSNKDEWVIDSGATRHMSHNKEKIVILDNDCNKEKKILGDDTTVDVIGTGNVGIEDGVFNNVMLVPNLKSNLLFVIQIANQGYKVEFYKDKFLIKYINSNYKVVASRYAENGLYKFGRFTSNEKDLVAEVDNVSRLWHER